MRPSGRPPRGAIAVQVAVQLERHRRARMAEHLLGKLHLRRYHRGMPQTMRKIFSALDARGSGTWSAGLRASRPPRTAMENVSDRTRWACRTLACRQAGRGQLGGPGGDALVGDVHQPDVTPARQAVHAQQIFVTRPCRRLQVNLGLEPPSRPFADGHAPEPALPVREAGWPCDRLLSRVVISMHHDDLSRRNRVNAANDNQRQ